MKNFKTIGSCVLSVLVVGSTLFSTACEELYNKRYAYYVEVFDFEN